MSELGDIIASRWRLDRELGAGGFATVYGATELGTGARVAIKLTRQAITGGYTTDTARRYQREVEVLERLTCAHTVRLFGHGRTADGTVYLVFEHVDGEELAQVLDRRGRLSGAEITHILGQLLLALDEAHRSGLLHRDLKPQNVLVFDRDGDPLSVKLIDFGIARSLDPDSTSLTQTGAIVGTPKYMSPEQLLRLPLTPASDLYSLGLMAFEMALGRDALHGGSIGEQIGRLRSGHLFSAPELDRLGALHTTISRMCARAPEDRYQSAHAVLNALGLAQESHVVVSPFGRRPWVVLATPLLVVLAIGLLFASVGLEAEADEDVSTLPATTRELPFQEPSAPERDLVEVDQGEDDGHKSVGCGRSGVEPGRTVLVGTRRYSSYIPGSYDPNTPLPLVVLVHDAGERADAFLDRTGFVDVAEKHGFAVVVPQGSTNRTWKVHDHFEIRRSFEAFASVVCVDLDRVFAVGDRRGAVALDAISCDDWYRGVARHARAPTVDARSAKEKLDIFTTDCEQPEARPTAIVRGAFEYKPDCDDDAAAKYWRRSMADYANLLGGRDPRIVTRATNQCEPIDGVSVPMSSCIFEGPIWPLKSRPDRCFTGPERFVAAEHIWTFFDGLERTPRGEHERAR